VRADDIRAENAELDEELLALARSVTDDELARDGGDGEWTVAQNLGHIGEFPAFFAGELERWLADRSAPIGRTHEHDDRLAAIEAASGRSAAELVGGIEGALAALATSLEGLSDADVDATMSNRKYGDEPVTAFLERYVTGHKRAHVEQLDRTLRLVRGA
jgi:hypothetical protein